MNKNKTQIAPQSTHECSCVLQSWRHNHPSLRSVLCPRLPLRGLEVKHLPSSLRPAPEQCSRRCPTASNHSAGLPGPSQHLDRSKHQETETGLRSLLEQRVLWGVIAITTSVCFQGVCWCWAMRVSPQQTFVNIYKAGLRITGSHIQYLCLFCSRNTGGKQNNLHLQDSLQHWKNSRD